MFFADLKEYRDPWKIFRKYLRIYVLKNPFNGEKQYCLDRTSVHKLLYILLNFLI